MTDRYEPHCDCLGGHVDMRPDPNGRWCRDEVKPLEWVRDPEDCGDDWFSQAWAGVYCYEVGCDDDGWWWQEDAVCNASSVGSLASEDEAKAAAQADFEARILSALWRPTMPDSTDPRAVADDPSGIVQQMPVVTDATAPEWHLANILGYIASSPADLRGLDDDDALHADIKIRVGDVRAAYRSLIVAMGSDGKEQDRWVQSVDDACPHCGGSGHKDDCRDTEADLRAEVERLLALIGRKDAALREAADELDAYYRAEYHSDHPLHQKKRAFLFEANPARAALSPETDGGQ